MLLFGEAIGIGMTRLRTRTMPVTVDLGGNCVFTDDVTLRGVRSDDADHQLPQSRRFHHEFAVVPFAFPEHLCAATDEFSNDGNSDNNARECGGESSD